MHRRRLRSAGLRANSEGRDLTAETTRRSGERGAVVIQVAIALLMLIALTSFVLDYGVMWASRGQAQTSADAAALAGAVSLAFESSTDFAAAKIKARGVAQANGVWGAIPDVQLSDITFPACPPGAPGPPDTCIKVDVFRNQRAGGSPLPMFFGNLLGVSNQGVRATATAQIVGADTTDCMRPWAVVDRWDEWNEANPGAEHQTDRNLPDPDYGPLSTYDKYSDGKGKNPPPEDDLYRPATSTSNGTGFRLGALPNDEGRQYAIKVGDSSGTVSSGWFRAIRLPRVDGGTAGGSIYRDNIDSCNGYPSSYAEPGTVCPTVMNQSEEVYWAARGCYRVETGNKVGPTQQGIDGLIAKDSGASWDNINKKIVGSTFTPPTKSPRVVPIGVMNIDLYLAADPTGGGGVLRMENIYGFFIEGMGDVNADGSLTLKANGKSVIGRIMTIPAFGTSTKTITATFLRSIILVR